jgi:hypothetical protein
LNRMANDSTKKLYIVTWNNHLGKH